MGLSPSIGLGCKEDAAMYVRYHRKPAIPCGPRQFSLWDLMVFVTVFSLWCSQVAVVKDLWNAPRGVPTSASLLGILLAWCALAVYYYRQRLFALLGVQCIMPMFLGGLSGNLTGFFLVALLVNLLCFPGAALTVAVRWLRRPRGMEATEALRTVELSDEPSEEPRPGADQPEPPGR
jgi:hypothetical protein